MRFQQIGIVREFGHVRPVGVAVTEQHVHHRAGERRIRAGLRAQVHIGLARRRRTIGIDDDQPRAAVLSRAGNMGHQIDLGVDRVGAPDDDQVRLGEFAGIAAALRADAGRHP